MFKWSYANTCMYMYVDDTHVTYMYLEILWQVDKEQIVVIGGDN